MRIHMPGNDMNILSYLERIDLRGPAASTLLLREDLRHSVLYFSLQLSHAGTLLGQPGKAFQTRLSDGRPGLGRPW